METALQIFEKDGKELTGYIDENGEPWFYASDVCKLLEIKNSRSALSRLDEDEKGVRLNDTQGGTQTISVINESGLYSLTLTSKKNEAKDFKRWVTHDVIPSIRKTGKYEVKPLTDDEILQRGFLIATKRVEALTLENSELKAQREADKPKLENYAVLMNDEGLYTMEICAKSIGTSRNRLIGLLKEKGVFTKSGMPVQEQMRKFRFKVITTILEYNGKPYPQVHATTAGFDFICSLFKTLNSTEYKQKGLV